MGKKKKNNFKNRGNATFLNAVFPKKAPIQTSASSDDEQLRNYREDFGFSYRYIDFLNEMEGMFRSAPDISSIPTIHQNKAQKKIDELIKDGKVTIYTKDDGLKSYRMNYPDTREALNALMEVEKFKMFNVTLPRAFSILLVTIFENYLNDILIQLFKEKEELLNAHKAEFTLAQLNSSKDISDLKNIILEKEVENILNQKQLDRFDWFKDHGIDIHKIPYKSEVFETILRRNLFAHTRGIVNGGYLEPLKNKKYQIDTAAIFPKGLPLKGDSLSFDRAYHVTRHSALLIFTMLFTQHIIRGILKNDEMADALAIEASVYIITSERFSVAAEVIENILNEFDFSKRAKNQAHLKINLATSYRLLGDFEKSKQVVSEEDWSGYSEELRMAKEITLRNFTEAAKLMERIEVKKITKSDYAEWPLFNEFRNTAEFKSTFKKLFNEEFKGKAVEQTKGFVGIAYLDADSKSGKLLTFQPQE